MNNNLKILIANIIIVVLAVVSIITLCVGSFMKIQINVDIKGDTISKLFAESNQGGEGEPITDGTLKIVMENTGNTENTENTEQGEDVTVEDIDVEKILSKINLKFDLELDLKSAVMMKSISGGGSDVIKEMLGTQINNVVDALLINVDAIIDTAMEIVVDSVVETAQAEVMEQLKEELGKTDVTEEEIMQELESEYGITEDNIEELKGDISESAKNILNGEPEKVSETINNSETMDKLMAVYAEKALKEEKGEDYVASEEEIASKKSEIKQEIVTEYEATIDEMRDENGELSKESIIVEIMSESELKDASGNAVEIKSIEDIKTYISNSATNVIDGKTANIISTILKVFGILILVVVASWAYIIVKIVVKLFMRNKTVGLLAPRLLGWIPHVLFVGVPMFFVKNMGKVLEAASTEIGAEAQSFTEILSMITLDISSLTWVSALCSVLLLIIWIPYYRWRRQAKRM